MTKPKPWPDVRLSDTITARRCACRGWIVAPEAVSSATGEKIRQHQDEEPHKSWRSYDWVESNTTRVDVPIAQVKKVA